MTIADRVCYNPSHIYEGTQQRNIDDMMERGRWNAGPPSGERNGNARLTDAQRSAIIADTRGSRTIAPEYGVHSSTIRKLRHKANQTKGCG